MAAAAAGYLLFGLRQRRAPSPLVDLRLLARRPVGSGTFVIAVATALMVAVFFLGSFFLQDVMGHDALVTGLLFLPVAAATTAGAQGAGRVVGRLGGRAVALAGLGVAAIGLVVPVLWTGTAGTVVGLAVAAAGVGALFLVASATALGQVEPEQSGVASGIVSTFHEFGASIGAALVSSAAAASLVTGTGDGFARAFALAAGVAVVAAVVSAVWLPPLRRDLPTPQDSREVTP